LTLTVIYASLFGAAGVRADGGFILVRRPAEPTEVRWDISANPLIINHICRWS
jgi:hypothetical protein